MCWPRRRSAGIGSRAVRAIAGPSTVTVGASPGTTVEDRDVARVALVDVDVGAAVRRRRSPRAGGRAAAARGRARRGGPRRRRGRPRCPCRRGTRDCRRARSASARGPDTTSPNAPPSPGSVLTVRRASSSPPSSKHRERRKGGAVERQRGLRRVGAQHHVGDPALVAPRAAAGRRRCRGPDRGASSSRRPASRRPASVHTWLTPSGDGESDRDAGTEQVRHVELRPVGAPAQRSTACGRRATSRGRSRASSASSARTASSCEHAT